jgi:hypothetical protein
MLLYSARFSRYCWFAHDLPWYGFATLTQYHGYLGRKPSILWHHEAMYTLTIDLMNVRSSFIETLNKKTRYEINRAEREGITFCLHDDRASFLDFYNDFARSKSLSLLSETQLSHLPKENICFTKAVNSNTNETLVMHCYLHDKERTRLLFSCSHYRSDSQQSLKSLIGMANRYLHYQDIAYFKQNGWLTYDLGGIAYQTNNPALQKINHFKEEFSQQLETSYLVLPRWMHWLKWLQAKIL